MQNTSSKGPIITSVPKSCGQLNTICRNRGSILHKGINMKCRDKAAALSAAVELNERADTGRQKQTDVCLLLSACVCPLIHPPSVTATNQAAIKRRSSSCKH